MAKTERLLITMEEELKNDMAIRMSKIGEKYYSSYIRNLIKKDCNYDFSSIKNSDIYNKLIDLNLEIKDIKDYIIKNG